ncbi:MAG: helix-turn-helix transcriptional regulator [Fibrobacter sp.]|nr:helix-turn-helix transcriptional regulator [Fibrobacter sp.]
MEAKRIQIRLGQRIREHRNLLGLSQEKFALLIGMDRTYLASVETGNRNISIVNLEKISKGLNISLSQLFENI